MTEHNADQIAELTISAVVIRADGTVEDLGVISEYKRPLWKSIVRKVTTWLRP